MHGYAARRLGPVLMGSIALIGLGGFGGLTVSPAGAAPAAPAARTAKLIGTYSLSYNFGDGAWGSEVVDLLSGHKGAIEGHPSEQVRWTKAGDTVTIVVTLKDPAVQATYVGKTSHKGFNSAKHPGTFTNSLGSAGVWYAVRTT